MDLTALTLAFETILGENEDLYRRLEQSATLGSDNDALLQQNSALQRELDRLAPAAASAPTLAAELRAAKDALTEATRELRRLSDEHRRALSDNASLSSQLAGQREELVATAAATETNLRKELVAARGDAQKTVSALRGALTVREKELAETQAALTALRAQNLSLSDAAAAYDSEMAAQRVRASEQSEALASLRRTAEEAVASRNQALAELGAAREEVVRLRASHHISSASILDAESALRRSHAEELTTLRQTLSEERDELIREAASLRSERDSLSARVGQLKATVDRLSNPESSPIIASLRDQCAAMSSRRAKAEKALADLKDSTEASMRAATMTEDELRQRIGTIEYKLASADQRLAEASTEVASLRDRSSRRATELNAARASLLSSEAELHALRRQLADAAAAHATQQAESRAQLLKATRAAAVQRTDIAAVLASNEELLKQYQAELCRTEKLLAQASIRASAAEERLQLIPSSEEAVAAIRQLQAENAHLRRAAEQSEEVARHARSLAAQAVGNAARAASVRETVFRQGVGREPAESELPKTHIS
jgi:chromosome segregation ATPase